MSQRLKNISYFALGFIITYTLINIGFSLLNHKRPRPSNITPQASHSNHSTEFVSGYYKGNYIWGGAMTLAWNELNENILHDKLKLNTTDPIALEMVKTFNNASFSKKDLDESSYYIKSGYGNKTIAIINKEVKEKFPNKSFEDITIKLAPSEFISYAYLLKNIEYEIPFDKTASYFTNTLVDVFYAETTEQKNSVKILKYTDDDHFIIKVKTKPHIKTKIYDEIFLAKGFDMNDPANVLQNINDYNRTSLPHIDKKDTFYAPVLHLNYHRDYTKLINKHLANKNFEQYIIAYMFEDLKFDMDNKGARIENQAVIAGCYAAPGTSTTKPPRHFYLDKPYWIIIKQSNSSHPYLILGINNTNLMTIANQLH